MPWILDELGQSDKIDWSFAPDQTLPRALSQAHVVPDASLWPLRLTQASPASTSVPDFTAGPMIGLVVVSTAFKTLVQAMDPVPHIFAPLIITRPDGSTSTGDHHLFKQGSFVEDGIIPEQSEIRVNVWQGEVSHYTAKTLSPRLTWRRSAIAGRHLWADRHLKTANVVSDAFYAEMQARGMKGFLAIESRLADSDA